MLRRGVDGLVGFIGVAACATAIIGLLIALRSGNSESGTDLPLRQDGGSAVPASLPQKSVRSEASMTLPIESAAVPAPPRAENWSQATKEAIFAKYDNAADERIAIVAALEEAESCSEEWCAQASSILGRWRKRATEELADAVDVAPVACSAAGCWTTLRLRGRKRLRELIDLPNSLNTTDGWHGVSMIGGPDLSDPESISTLWVLVRPE